MHCKLGDSKECNKLEKINRYMNKLVYFNYELFNKFDIIYISLSSFYISLKILEQFYQTFNTKVYLEYLKTCFKIDNSIFFTCAEEVLKTAKSFDSIYYNCKNLNKYENFN